MRLQRVYVHFDHNGTAYRATLYPIRGAGEGGGFTVEYCPSGTDWFVANHDAVCEPDLVAALAQARKLLHRVCGSVA